ncbi:hypothetical protein [Pseudonocardia sp. MH-G8]|uniref:hypothetical protein n=1 Tax=Pseudonocardia sp. MH-G8 TaxID=1854588 RepID=UPI001E5F1997|nr:hypothetical protein [Pseudonocardia sp. MH-G8]
MTATPDVRLDDPLRNADGRYPAVETGCDEVRAEPPVAARTVSPEQVDCAVVQLRERRGRTAAEQMQAVLRALDLTVECRNEHRR